jgi:hypothetical protein
MDKLLNYDLSLLKEYTDTLQNFYNYNVSNDVLRNSFPPHFFYKYDGGICVDNNRLKSITVGIPNYEKQFYIPSILKMYAEQDYPKHLIEILVVDDDSRDKDGILKMLKEETIKYPDLKIRFIQNYINKCSGPCGRRNIVFRHATNEIVITNESDTIPVNRDFLRGISYSHSLRNKLICMPVPTMMKDYTNRNKEFFFDDPYFILNEELVAHYRYGHDYVISMEIKYAKEMQGYCETIVGWGGAENNFVYRFCDKSDGMLYVNSKIVSVELPNFPQGMPDVAVGPKQESRDTQTYQANDANWGLTDNMEEIDLYKPS